MPKTTASQPMDEPSNHEKKLKRLIRGLLILLFVLLLCCGYLLWRYHKNSSNTAESKQRHLTAQLDKVAVRPDEEPVITSVAKASKLTNKVLSKEAHNGDILFIFTKAHRIILYRPLDHKVVDMLNLQPSK
jgi:hypothetical protein